MYQYRAYGIGFHSEIPIYQFEETETEADVFIRLVDSGLDRTKYEKEQKWLHYQEDQAWVLSLTAQFLIREGKYIDVCNDRGATDIDLAAYICGWCMSFLFTQRGYSAIHCTALEFGDGAVLVAGVSGAGKSTTATELIRRGHRYLADDIAMIRPEDDFLVQPAFPVQKVCRDVAEALQGEDLLYVDERKDKFARRNKAEFCPEARPLKGIVLLQIGENTNTEVAEPQGFDKYLKLFSILFNGKLFVEEGINQADQYRMLKLAEKVPYMMITRPGQKDTLQEICHLIEKRFD